MLLRIHLHCADCTNVYLQKHGISHTYFLCTFNSFSASVEHMRRSDFLAFVHKSHVCDVFN